MAWRREREVRKGEGAAGGQRRARKSSGSARAARRGKERVKERVDLLRDGKSVVEEEVEEGVGAGPRWRCFLRPRPVREEDSGISEGSAAG